MFETTAAEGTKAGAVFSLGPSLRRSAWRKKSSRWICNRLRRNFCLADVCVSATVGGRGHFKCLGLEAAQGEKNGLIR